MPKKKPSKPAKSTSAKPAKKAVGKGSSKTPKDKSATPKASQASRAVAKVKKTTAATKPAKKTTKTLASSKTTSSSVKNTRKSVSTAQSSKRKPQAETKAKAPIKAKLPAKPAPAKTKATAKPAPAKSRAPAKAPAKNKAATKAKATAKKAPAKKPASSPQQTPIQKVPRTTVTAVPVAQVNRIKVQRPHAFTIEDVEELLKTRGTKESSAPVKKTTSAQSKQKSQSADHHPPQKKQVHSAASLADILGFNPKEKAKPEERALADIPKKFHKNYKELQKLRAQVKESLEFHTEETLNRSAKEDSGDLSGYGQHQADVGTDNYDRDFALSLVSDEQELLFEIEEAIKRIHQGTYGICEVTGKPIAKERLIAVPFARYSLEGQIEYEKTQRRHVQRRGIFDSSLEDSSSFGGDDDAED